MTRDEFDKAFKAGWEAAKIERDGIIEECAHVAESWYSNDFSKFTNPQEAIAAAIRALKD